MVYMWARETGTICQIGVFAGKRCIFWAQKGSYSAILHYVFNECRLKTVSCSITISVVRSRRKWPFWPQEMLRCAVERASLTNLMVPISRIYMGGVPAGIEVLARSLIRVPAREGTFGLQSRVPRAGTPRIFPLKGNIRTSDLAVDFHKCSFL